VEGFHLPEFLHSINSCHRHPSPANFSSVGIQNRACR
jgi:hypothetical protein